MGEKALKRVETLVLKLKISHLRARGGHWWTRTRTRWQDDLRAGSL